MAVHVPLGEDGDGKYSLATRGCFEVIRSCMPTLLTSLRACCDSVNEASVFTIADYGAADGGTSLPALNELVHEVKQTKPDAEVLVVYEDQPGNEWRSLFNTVLGKLPIPGVQKTFLEAFTADVFVMACGRSFYEQVLPSRSLHFGMAFTSMHWLSKCPGPLPKGALHHSQAPADSGALQTFKAQAAADWELILLQRTRELRAGGRLVLANLAMDEEGQCLGRSHAVEKCMYDEKYKCWAAMQRDGRITEEELERTVFPNYYRSLKECCAPVTDTSSPVYRAGLRLLHSETLFTPCPYRAKWLADHAVLDPLDYAREFVLTTRTWSNSTYESALDHRRSSTERRKLVDELFERYAQEVAKQPSAHGMDYLHVVLTLEKIQLEL